MYNDKIEDDVNVDVWCWLTRWQWWWWGGWGRWGIMLITFSLSLSLYIYIYIYIHVYRDGYSIYLRPTAIGTSPFLGNYLSYILTRYDRCVHIYHILYITN